MAAIMQGVIKEQHAGSPMLARSLTHHVCFGVSLTRASFDVTLTRFGVCPRLAHLYVCLCATYSLMCVSLSRVTGSHV